MKHTFLVSGWFDGSSYDKGNLPDETLPVVADNESEAEDIGDRRLKTMGMRCEVIIAEVED
jgi:hypothetical protein